ncbi:hypothetical protein [Desulfospira joergensenii]|uniref:hypothetical protein n=1 Tax=Desulfospira joergensenii TaxID=53329 RepID=UPI0003B759C6|nr:hypothetical protein [Desulfospira joergensenii]
MIHKLKDIVRKSTLYLRYKEWKYKRREKKELINWEKKGRPAPPPHLIKQQALRHFAEKFKLEVLVETGTYFGDMVEAMRPYFTQIYSIELSRELFQKAMERFNNVKNVTIIHGDSGVELEKLTCVLKGKSVLFWLDGHYSAGVTARGDKDTPIYEELTHIFNADLGRCVILIDDARCFGDDPAYPSIEELSGFIKENSPAAEIEVKDDSIRIIPIEEPV